MKIKVVDIQQVFDYISLAIGIVAVLIIVYGILVGLIEFVRAEWKNLRVIRARSFDFQSIRHHIGFHLLLGLEFLIAADVIRTVIRPSLEELAVLGGIVAIRTVISYFLGRELGQYDSRRG
ncbi:MAG: DUF1622 domain-containing protein [Chloroflexi bacterium]|nr:DUF1622 domain-containing protein [Chloroflexota bacterium]